MLNTYTCRHTQIQACAHVHTCTLAHMQKDVHTHTHTCTNMCTPACTHAHMHPCIHSEACAHTRTHMHINSRSLLIISDFHRHLRWGTHQGQGAAFQPSKHGILLRNHCTSVPQHPLSNSWPTALGAACITKLTVRETSPSPLLFSI